MGDISASIVEHSYIKLVWKICKSTRDKLVTGESHFIEEQTLSVGANCNLITFRLEIESKKAEELSQSNHYNRNYDQWGRPQAKPLQCRIFFSFETAINGTMTVQYDHENDTLVEINNRHVIFSNCSLPPDPIIINLYWSDNQVQDLTTDFNVLLKDELYTDVILRSVDGFEFKVHKCILASRCSVLKAHFEHSTVESATGIVESLLEGDVLHEMLKFIYSGKVSDVVKYAEKLIPAADFYGLQKLKNICECELIKQLTVNNAVKILDQANKYSADYLYKKALCFIKNPQNAQTIIETEDWINYKDTDVIKDIIKNIVSK